MKKQRFFAVFPIMILFFLSLSYGIADDDPYRQEKETALDMIIWNVLHGKTDGVEILITEIPREPAQPVSVSDLEGPVNQPDGWAWLAVIDDLPGAYGHHPARWVFLDRGVTKIILILNKETLPRIEMNHTRIGFDILLDYIPKPQEIPKRDIPEAPSSEGPTDFSYDNYYAVIIQGDLPSGDSYNEFWLDNVIMYQALIEKGYLPENIYVLYGYGNDETTFPCEWYQETMVDFPAYKQDVRNLFTWMRDGNPERGVAKVTANDFIYLYTFDHGGSQGGCNATLCLMDGCMPDTEFASYFNDIPYKHRAVVMQQCYSGGFVDNLQNSTTVILTAANCYQSAYEGNEYEMCNNHIMHHGEFNYWYMSAMRGHKPLPGEEPVDEDRNSDGKVSFWEAYQYVIENDDRYESPQYSDLGSIGDILSLQAWLGPTLKYHAHDIDDSGSYGNNDGVAGPGETFAMPVALANIGNETAQTVAGTLRCDSPDYVRILNREANFPDILEGETGTSLAPHYELSIDPDAPCGMTVNMTLDVTEAQSERMSEFLLPIGRIQDDYPSADTPLSIPKKTTGTVSIRNVPDSFTIQDINVSVNITHGDIGELLVILRSPAGTAVTLHNKSRPGTQDINTTYDAARLPDGPGSMNDFNGQNPAGDWTLTVTDDVAGKVPGGTLNSWTLRINATAPFNCTPLACGEPEPSSIGNALRLVKENQTDLRLYWESIAGASDYRIWKSQSPDFIDEIYVGKTSGGSTYYTDSGALNDPISYHYRVRAINSCNQEGP